MEQQIIDIVSQALNAAPGDVTAGSKAADFSEWDSLRQVMILAEIEEQLHCSIPIDKAMGIDSVQGLVDAAKAGA